MHALHLPDPVFAIAFGPTEIAVVIFLAFLLFGAKKIPELMRSLGRAQGEYQKAKRDFEREVKVTEGKAASDAGAAFTPYKDLDAARAKATDLGIETADKGLQELNEAIAKKVGGPTA